MSFLIVDENSVARRTIGRVVRVLLIKLLKAKTLPSHYQLIKTLGGIGVLMDVEMTEKES